MTERIEERTRRFLAGLPPGVKVLAAAKTRRPDEIAAAISGGVRIVGQNYVQEAQRAIDALGPDAAEWHMIGHLQRNKAADAVHLFDLIQSLDSLRLAKTLDRQASKLGRSVPVLVEINSAEEPQKTGILPDDTADFVREAAKLPSLRIAGLMTMGPFSTDPEKLRPFFRRTKQLFDRIGALRLERVDLSILSMGMSDSYAVAIEEGASMIRIGTALFGARDTLSSEDRSPS